MAVINHIQDLQLKGQTVFLRLDLNVPTIEGEIQDDSRILAALPTLQHVLSQTNKVCVASHLGRPKGQKMDKFSLMPVGKRLSELTNKEVLLVDDYDKEPVDQVLKQLGKNQFILLENLRFYEGETKNDLQFSKNLAKGIDYYIDDAFGVAHRRHASVVGVPELLPFSRKATGFLVDKETSALDKLIKSPQPFVVLLGGSKISDKIKLILNVINYCNDLIIGGAMAYTFLKYKGVDVGASLVEEDKMDLVDAVYRAAEARKVTIHLPVDHVCATHFLKEAQPFQIKEQSFAAPQIGLDIGSRTLENIGRVTKRAKSVFWNGPMGVFEWPSFSK